MHKENGQVIETAVDARAGFLDRPTPNNNDDFC